MHSQLSLVFFTLLVQSAVGGLWCIQLALFLFQTKINSSNLTYQLAVLLGLLLIGQVSAMAHLGKPSASVNAPQNLKSSWLSREILSVNFFFGVLAILVVLAFFRPALLNQWVILTGCFAGGMALYTMTRVYLLRTVPVWNHAATPLAFLGSTLLLGAILFSLLQLSIPFFEMAASHGADKHQFIMNYSLLLIGIGLKAWASNVKSWEKLSQTEPVKRMQPVVQLFGISILTASLPFYSRSNIWIFLVVSAALIMICGEIIDRINFYNNYRRVGI